MVSNDSSKEMAKIIPPKVAKSAGACGTWVLVLFIGALLEGTSNNKVQAPKSRKHPPILQLLEAPFSSFPYNCRKKPFKITYQNGFKNASNAKHSSSLGIRAPGHVLGPDPPILQLLKAPISSFPENCRKKPLETVYQNGLKNASNAKLSSSLGISAPGHVPGPDPGPGPCATA